MEDEEIVEIEERQPENAFEEVQVQLARSTPASRPGELFKALDKRHLFEAYENGMNLSRYLEQLDDSREHQGATTDAFQRQLEVAGFVTQSMPAQQIGASRLQDFDGDKNFRVLVPELLTRQWKRAVYGVEPTTRASLAVSGDAIPGSLVTPFAFADAPRYPQVAPAIPLSELIAFNTGITGNTYKKYWFDDNASQQRMVRVAEGAPIPAVKLVGQPQTIQLWKYGRKLEATYEVLRRLTFDAVQFHISKIAIQTESDKVDAVIDVIVNGDGNANTAALSYNLTTLDPSATVGSLTLKAYLMFRKKYKKLYVLTTLLGRDEEVTQLELLTTGSANIPLVMLPATVGYNGITPINQQQAGVRYGWTDSAPASGLLGIDKRFGVERVYEIGSDISEAASYVDRQVDYITFTEVEGYGIIDRTGNKFLNFAA